MKLVLKPVHIVTAQSMGATFTTTAFPVTQSDILGIQINYTGSPVGSFSVQASLDHAQDAQGNIQVAGNWADVYLTVNGALTSSIAVPAGTSPILIDVYGPSMPYFRLVYTRVSGTGTADIYLGAKRIGS